MCFIAGSESISYNLQNWKNQPDGYLKSDLLKHELAIYRPRRKRNIHNKLNFGFRHKARGKSLKRQFLN
jgi:hypothetical protein